MRKGRIQTSWIEGLLFAHADRSKQKQIVIAAIYIFSLLFQFSTLYAQSTQRIDSAELAALDQQVKKLAFQYPDSSLMLGKLGLKQTMQLKDTALASSFWLNMGVAHYAKGAFDSALNYYEKAISYSQSTKTKFVLPLAMNNSAVIFQRIARIDTAIQIYSEILSIYKSRKDTARIGRCLFNLGKANLGLGKDSIGLEYIKRSIELYKLLGESAYKNLANAYNEIATVKYYDGEYLEALDQYQQSIRYYEWAGDTLKAMMPKGNIGNIHKDLKDYEKAAEVYKEVIEVKSRHQLYTVHFNYHNLGQIYDHLGSDELALQSFHRALNLRIEAGSMGYALSTAIQLAKFFQKRHQNDSASFYFQQAYAWSIDVDEEEFKLEAICAYGTWKLEQNDFQAALPLLEQSYIRARELNHKTLMANASKGLQQIYSGEGNYLKAYEFLQVASQLSDSLFNADLVRETTNRESSFKHEKELLQKQNEIALLESKEKLSRLRIFLLVSGLVLVSVLAFFITRLQIRKKREIQSINAFKEAMTGMIAHDLKNPLSIILNNKDVEKNQHTAKQMLQLINNMLDVQKFEAARMPLNLKQISIKTLVESASSQVELLTKQAQVEIKIDLPDIQIEVDQEIMERVFVNLLTNAIKYSPVNNEVLVSGAVENSMLQVSVTDHGRGIAKADQDWVFESFRQLDPKMSGGVGSTGLGLTFCKLAMEAHGSQLKLDSEIGEGTTFSFALEVISEEVHSHHENKSTRYLTMSTADKSKIRQRIEALKALNLHQIGEIEKELTLLKKQKSQGIDEWVEAVLDAAYVGNEERFKELLDVV